jgi:selenocysteine-specific elongation factor
VERHFVIGTAGHIDHGKTALVRALTGVDTDRLAEEKERGITIDLGFAPLDLGPELRASIVDVPGHEGFVRNMVAGSTGVDAALLVIAADEGIMPQTREHLAILKFLGVNRGVIVVTKSDLADAEWRSLVAAEARALVAAEIGAAWTVIETSATRETGLGELREALASLAGTIATREAEDAFRLPVDRVFSLPGAGTVVTGTVWSGSLSAGDHVTMLPSGIPARVRSIQVHGADASRALPGRRAALALVGPTRHSLTRGDVVLGGEGWRSSLSFDAEVSLLPAISLRPRSRVRIHHGTAEAMARVAIVEGSSPRGILMRIALESPLVMRAGDRFVIRSSSPVTTIGGGVVTEPWADWLPGPRRSRARPAPLAESAAARVADVVRRRGAHGLGVVALGIASGLGERDLGGALEQFAESGLARAGDWLVAEREVEAAMGKLLAALDQWHRDQRLEPGMPTQSWKAKAGDVEELADLAVERLAASGVVVREGSIVRRPDFKPGGSPEARLARDRVLEALRWADAEPPSVSELVARLPGTDVPGVLRLLARDGSVIAVGQDRYYEAAALGRERRRLEEALAATGPATPAAIRERLGRSRKWLIPLLEWADREGVTVREGDLRRLRLHPGA